MRRLVLSVAFVVLALMGAPKPAAATSVVCEGYCLAAASGCYATVGWLIGREKCDAFYEGCVAGCQAAAAAEEEEDLQEK